MSSPLAERLRPTSLDDFIGQEHLVGAKGVLRAAIKSGHLPSLIFWGPPGTGKTWILAKVKERLEELDQKVVCLAPTHCAARLLPDGDTVHHFVRKYAMQGAFKGWILCDEISMCGLGLLAALEQLRMNGMKFCAFGDWDPLPAHPES